MAWNESCFASNLDCKAYCFLGSVPIDTVLVAMKGILLHTRTVLYLDSDLRAFLTSAKIIPSLPQTIWSAQRRWFISSSVSLSHQINLLVCTIYTTLNSICKFVVDRLGHRGAICCRLNFLILHLTNRTSTSGIGGHINRNISIGKFLLNANLFLPDLPFFLIKGAISEPLWSAFVFFTWCSFLLKLYTTCWYKIGSCTLLSIIFSVNLTYLVFQ